MVVEFWRGDAISKQIDQAVKDGMEEWHRAVLMPDADENCPVAEVNGGTMRNSHYTEVKEDEITSGYGGSAASYAIIQHERTDFHHTTGEAKWLENSANRNAAKLPEIIQERVSGAL